MSKYILSLDQGTTSSRSILFDSNAKIVATAQQEFTQHFPKPGWVEHCPEDIWQTQLHTLRQVIRQTGITTKQINAIGITNQRETTLVWDKTTGKPVTNAIVWQDRRTANVCENLQIEGRATLIRQKTGLVLDAYFSATKVKWILDNIPGARHKADSGELLFGTVDTWLVWKLTNGTYHITDVSNASRTMLFNIETMAWDDELLDLFSVPESMLPQVVDSSGKLAVTSKEVVGAEIPITGIVGDQQAALFGQLCLKPGMAKSTYGTGCFLMLNTGKEIIRSRHQMLSTVGWKINGEVTYALEGSVFVGGAVIQWLRDEMGFFVEASDSEKLAEAAEDNGGVYFVPALTGLGAPYWDPDARGSIFGITRGTTKGHLTRAALESICFQVNDVLQSMDADIDFPISALRVDGGAAANHLLVQFQSDISRIHTVRPMTVETTALGAAFMAGLGSGWWSMDFIEKVWQTDEEFCPQMDESQTHHLLARWNEAVKRSLGWEKTM